MPDWCVIDFATGLNRAHHHLSGVNTETRFQRGLTLLSKTASVVAQVPLHLQGRIQRALWMVLVCSRCPEQCEYPVAGRLRTVAFIAADCIDQDPEGRIDDRASLFGIGVIPSVRSSP
jgi:uncharacterized metal-binding protein YceD (DUF177 family)